MKPKPSWIIFEPYEGFKSEKTKCWTVRPTDLSGTIGFVRWYSPWRRYAFYAHGGAVFEQDCLREIAQFCENATLLHREALKQRKAATA